MMWLPVVRSYTQPAAFATLSSSRGLRLCFLRRRASISSRTSLPMGLRYHGRYCHVNPRIAGAVSQLPAHQIWTAPTFLLPLRTPMLYFDNKHAGGAMCYAAVT